MNKEKSYAHIVAGGVSGVFVSIATQPFDVLKTNLIGARERNPLFTNGKMQNQLQGTISFISTIYKTEGLRGLWRGLVPTSWRYLPGGAMYFGSIHFLKLGPLNTKNNGLPHPVNDFLIGAISKSCATISTMPILVVKTRFESIQACESMKSRSVSSTIKEIYNTGGIRGLFAGVTPTLLRDIPYSGLFYLFYRQSNDLLSVVVGQDATSSSNQIVSVAAISSIFAGASATLITHPFDLIRTRLQLPNQGGYSGFMDALVTIPKEEGLRSLFLRGIVPKIMKRGLGHAISWSLYESTVLLTTK
ncbi:hypothetical protein FDP41_006173 [Naegleria fowleri]|uniref:Solute carrier family 25 member 38 homolog n=1 Tax=Naegleria fowleri TaxID=5763 RepID=A0A6A5BP54_NAEFO|nr:uncharacterized protein FDP41_006173 [Naegleria fowleri]KAF0974699.1 hypothetical protein FDP41_006173 [Naegleria fowleri]